MTTYIRGPNPIWFMANLTGQPLDDTYWAFFLTNDLPYVPQNVYQDPNGISAWPDPLEFQPSSGLPNNLYFDPSLTYRIEIRQGNTQSDALIWLVQNYMASDNSSGTNTDTLLTAENMLTNPQFADIYFNSPLTITTAGTYDIAPGWQLVLAGSGTVSTTITQILTAGDQNISGNPAYALEFNNSGWSSAKLIQKLSNNGALYRGGAIGAAMSAYATSSSKTVSLSYEPSTGSAITILNASVNTGSFQQFGGAVNIPSSTNSDTGTNAYVNFVVSLPETGDVTISNLQFTGQEDSLFNTDIVPVYQEIAYPRMVDHEFNIYRDSIILQPKDTLLVGWEFGLNPWQFYGSTGATPINNGYITDQTVIVQQDYVTNNIGSNVSFARGSYTENFGLKITALTANNQFALFQYIDPNSIGQFWGYTLSALAKAFLVKGSGHTTSIKIKMRLFYKAGLPGSTARKIPVDSWTVGGDPVFAGGYTSISPRNDPAYTLGTTAQQFAFEGFVLPASTDVNQTLGVMIYTVGLMDQTGTADYLIFNDVSLVPNDFSIASNPKTFDQVLRECQFYYETSYPPLVALGSLGHAPAYSYPQDMEFVAGGSPANQWNLYPTPFSLRFETKKRGVPSTISFFSPSTGTADRLDASQYQGSSTATNAAVASFSTNFDATTNLDVRGFTAVPNSSNTLVQTTGASTDHFRTGIISFHWAASSLLGI